MIDGGGTMIKLGNRCGMPFTLPGLVVCYYSLKCRQSDGGRVMYNNLVFANKIQYAIIVILSCEADNMPC